MEASKGSLLSLFLVLLMSFLISFSVGESQLLTRKVRQIEVKKVEFPKYVPSGQYNVSHQDFTRPSTIGFWYQWEKTFMNLVQPKKPSIDLIVQIINETKAKNSAIDAALVWKWLQKPEVVGVLVLVIIGLVFVFGIVFGGLIFCLCQCCSRGYQKHDESGAKCSRFTLSFLIFFFCFWISFGIGMFATSLSDLHRSANSLPDVVNASFGQINDMMTGTQLEIDTMIRGGYHFSKQQIFTDLNNSDVLLSNELYMTFEKRNANVTLLRVLAVGEELPVVINTLETSTIRTALPEFQQDMNELSDELDRIARDLRIICRRIGNNAPPANCAASGVDPEALQLNPLNLTLQFNIDDTTLQLKEIQASNWQSVAEQGYLEYQTIPAQITEQIPDVTTGLSDALVPVDNEIDSLMVYIADGVASVQKTVQPYHRDVVDATSYPRQYNAYITGASIGLSLFFALLVTLTLLGCCIGGSTYKTKVLPTDRTGAVRMGSGCMMTTVYLTLIFSWIFMLATIALFIAGSQTDSTICPILQGSHDNFSGLEQIIDRVAGPNPPTLNGSISIKSIPSLLSSCRDGATVYTALELANRGRRQNDALARLNITDNIDFNQTIGGLQGSLSELSVFNNDTAVKLQEILDVLDGANFGDLLVELDKPLNRTDFGVVKTNLDALAQTLTSAGQQPDTVEVQRLSARLGTLNDKLVNETEQKRLALYTEVDRVNDVLRNFTSEINETLIAAVDLQFFVQDELTRDDGVLQEVENDLGRCRPLYDVYDTATSFVCSRAISALNGVWFALGLIVMCLLLTMFFSCCLSKYYRRAKKTNVRVETESHAQPVQRLYVVDHVNYAYR